ncbi:MAG: DnaB-like helicase C-terminal domain-containing protein [Candidatus Magnetobacterium sp. LHC-1]
MIRKKTNFEKIISIKPVGNIQTYDFTIPKNHCFFANKILVHNTGALEQLSHVVLLIFRIIDEQNNMKCFVKIAKNRNGETGEREVNFNGSMFKFSEYTEKIREEWYE